jgi:hypothetical protein
LSTGNPIEAFSYAVLDFAVDIQDFFSGKSREAANSNLHNMRGQYLDPATERWYWQTPGEASAAINALAWKMYDTGDPAIWHLINDYPHGMQSYKDYSASFGSWADHVFFKDINPINEIKSLANTISYGFAPETTITRLYGPRPQELSII